MKPPKHLSASARRWFTEVMSTFDMEEHHIRLLLLACQSWDRSEQARAEIARHGLIYTDAGGQPRTRPEIAIERDSRLAFARLLRELDLDVAGPGETPRPPALRSNRRL